MSSRLEYHISVRHSNLAPVALLSLLALVSIGQAQINGAPSSVTSPGFGGRAINGTPASVTSLGPRGYAPNSRVTFSSPISNPGDGGHHHHHYVQYNPSYVYAVPVPYAVDIAATDPGIDNDNDREDDSRADDRDANYQGGPTVFDRRGSGANSYVQPVRDVPTPHSVERAAAEPAVPDPPQAPTLIVFKDGHKIEVVNYAIIGETLFDLTPGHSRRVALADLDLEATIKQNDDQGITFQLPQPN